MDKLKKLFISWSTKGVKLPYGYDPVTKAPSITIVFPYITFIIACVSVIGLHFFPKMLVATSMSIFFWGVSVIFYMLRKLSKATIDFDDKLISLDSGVSSDKKIER